MPTWKRKKARTKRKPSKKTRRKQRVQTVEFKKPVVVAKGKLKVSETPSWLMRLINPKVSLKQSVDYRNNQDSQETLETGNPFPSVIDLAYLQAKKESAKRFFTDGLGRIRVMNYN